MQNNFADNKTSKTNLTLRRLRGGVKIRASEFLGGGFQKHNIQIHPAATLATKN